MALLRTRAAFSGAAMNLMKALASSGSFETVNRPTPKRPDSISSFGNGPRYMVPATGWMTFACSKPAARSRTPETAPWLTRMVISAASADPVRLSTPATAANATFVQIPVLNSMATSLFFGRSAPAYTISPPIGQHRGASVGKLAHDAIKRGLRLEPDARTVRQRDVAPDRP